MKELTVDADVKNLDSIMGFIEEVLSPFDCPPAIQFQLEVALEEIYVNIAYYAYPEVVGATTIRSYVTEEGGQPPLLTMDIYDQGKPYNPLEHDAPDIELSAEDREIGGLGIFMVKNSMDALSYRYEENSNIFTVSKYLK